MYSLINVMEILVKKLSKRFLGPIKTCADATDVNLT